MLDNQGVAYAILLAISLTVYVVPTIFLVLRRNRFPMNGRSIVLVVVANVGVVATCINWCLDGMQLSSCRSQLTSSWPVGLLFLHAHLARVTRLWLLISQAKEKSVNHKLKLHGVQPYSTWFTDHRSWASSTFLVKCVAAITLLQIVVVEISYNVLLARGNECANVFGTAVSVYIAYEALVIAAMVFTAYKIRNLRDGYFMKDESKRLGYLAAAFAVARALSITGVLDNKYLISNGIFTILGVCFPLITVVWVLYKSHVYALRTRMTSTEDLPKLSEMLQLEEFKHLVDEFQEYLESLFALENLLFVKDVRRLHEFCATLNADDEDNRQVIVDRVMEVWREYIRCDAPSWVNLPSHIHSDIVTELNSKISNFKEIEAEPNGNIPVDVSGGTVDPTIYESARASITGLMSDGTFAQWKVKRFKEEKQRNADIEDSSMTSPNSLAAAVIAARDSSGKRLSLSGDQVVATILLAVVAEFEGQGEVIPTANEV